MEYWEHPSYGHENTDHKVVTVTFKSPLTQKQTDVLFDTAPQLDEKFDDLTYTDGEKDGASFDHGWEKTDTVPRGLISYAVTPNDITIKASDGLMADRFIAAARYIMAECARVVNPEVSGLTSKGGRLAYTGSTLKDVGDTLNAVTPQYSPPHRRRDSFNP